MSTEDDPLLTVIQAAKLLEVSRTHIYWLIKHRELKTETVEWAGRKYIRIRKSACVLPPQKKRGRPLKDPSKPPKPKKPKLKFLRRPRKQETRLQS